MSQKHMLRGTPDVASCREAAKTLQAYLDHEVDELSAHRITAHLELCRRCGMKAAIYRDIKSALARRGAVTDELALQRLHHFANALASGRIEPPPTDLDDSAGHG